jgi:hypothetical protein
MWSKIQRGILAWYEGKYVPHDNPPDSTLIFVNGGNYNRRWSAKAARVLIKFWLEHWKWIVGIVVAIYGIVASALRASGH